LHGWNGDNDTPFNEKVTFEYLVKDDVNVIRVDWSELARSINYFVAAARVPDAGLALGQFIDFLHYYNAIDFDRIMVVGFSLGGNVYINFSTQLSFHT
jgi:dienelactone hydrolase